MTAKGLGRPLRRLESDKRWRCALGNKDLDSQLYLAVLGALGKSGSVFPKKFQTAHLLRAATKVGLLPSQTWPWSNCGI